MEKKTFKIAVIGAGSWGTALAVLLSKKGYDVRLWARKKSHEKKLNKDRENIRYLPGFPFNDNLKVDSSLENSVKNAKIVVMVIPSHGYREIFNQLVEYIENNIEIISAVKGIENTTLKTMTQVMGEVLSQYDNVGVKTGVLSGPSFAVEVARGMPTAVTVGFKNIETARKIQKIFATREFRIYASRDIIGLEISAALKNIIAIATGVCDGLGYGLNTRAALITRGLAEIKKLGIELGATRGTFSGLSGLGDLILTCTGNLSRNRTVGLKLGQGKTIVQIREEMSMVAEGIKTTLSGYNLSKKLNIEMPILEQVYNIIYKNKDCSTAVRDLLEREMKEE